MAARTYVEKVLSRVLGQDVREGEVHSFSPDLLVLYDWPAISDWFFDMIENTLKIEELPHSDRIICFLDHLLPVANPSQEQFHKSTRQWCSKYGVSYYEDKGIGHSVVVEDGMVRPGMLVSHFDTHVSTVGAVGALGFGNMLEMLMPLVTGKLWLKVPPVIRVNLEGDFQPGVSARDLLHKIVLDRGPSWAINQVVEFGGPGAANISVEGRMVICDLSNYFGAMTSYFVPDSVTEQFMKNTGVAFELIKPDQDAVYSQSVTYNLADIGPTLVAPPSLDKAIPIEEAAGLSADMGIIGTCASGRIEDLHTAAMILQGKKIKEGFKLYIIPSSTKVFLKAMELGYIDTLVKAGAFISSPTCDYCYGKAVALGEGHRAVSTQTLNVPGRLGCMNAEIYLASAAVVAVTALEGTIMDPRNHIPWR